MHQKNCAAFSIPACQLLGSSSGQQRPAQSSDGDDIGPEPNGALHGSGPPKSRRAECGHGYNSILLRTSFLHLSPKPCPFRLISLATAWAELTILFTLGDNLDLVAVQVTRSPVAENAAAAVGEVKSLASDRLLWKPHCHVPPP